jgi:hypothetical protein
MQKEIRAATVQAFDAAGVAFNCYQKASRWAWAGDFQRSQLWERMGDLYMAINRKAKEEIAFLQWAERTEEAYDAGYWPE